ncbi:MAG: Ti-type conjugative transfer system protein TraG [Zhengella sp.]|jgi:type IV secretion system protein VirD4|uniref:Ti-type conjugative transfer system protein TraG n=1 Tax=Nitratireductor arenosus TaxID=2682096 RepID=A0A844QPR6_9HYPH|nr:Ti-type conjugative transfer system protein TraG [Nitratireductor arenosus]MVA99960.1 Ti-type conjugative transfer system protein TraG [Nitratireductor arenosus]
MTAKKLMLLAAPALMMLGIVLALQGIETWLASFGNSPESYQTLGRIGLALPYAAAAAIGVIFLFAANGSLAIQSAGLGVLIGGLAAVAFAALSEMTRLSTFASHVPEGTIFSYLDLYPIGGAATAFVAGMFGLRVALRGNAAFGATGPKRLSGRRAIHGDSHWMNGATIARLFPESGGIVLGERYRVDEDAVAGINFDPRRKETWGKGGKSPLVCFDCGFGSTHGIVFAGSGGYKTTSVVVPTALKFKGSLIVLDPSTEIAPMVAAHREAHGQDVLILDPKRPDIGFNVLDWIGRFGNAPEEDIASVAAWLMSEKPRVTSGADDFFRVSAEQLITGVIADVMLSDPDDTQRERSLRVVRARLAEPEETLKEKLADLYQSSTSRFVKEVIAPFINMTPQTFSGVYATAAKETHWLSYDSYAAIVSGNTFRTDDIANGRTTVFINIDLSTLENHPGMARVIIGAFLKAIYNRNGDMQERALFLLDEAARLGYMRIIETARDAGRKYGITLLMLFQSLGQMREAFGGRDATSKWFESASWVSFSAINDPETAKYISERCGMTTVEVNQVSRTSRDMGSSRTRSQQLSQRPLILPHEVTQMRADEQIILTGGNPPLRCGRAIYFRRPEMAALVGKSGFQPKTGAAGS